MKMVAGREEEMRELKAKEDAALAKAIEESDQLYAPFSRKNEAGGVVKR